MLNFFFPVDNCLALGSSLELFTTTSALLNLFKSSLLHFTEDYTSLEAE